MAIPASAGVGGSYGLEFLKLGGGARPLGMGEAYTAAADDVSSIYYNPAGLVLVNYPQVMTMSNNWFAGMTQTVVGAAYPVGYGVWGFGYSTLSSGDIQGYGPTGEVSSVFNTASSSLALSFGRPVNDQVNVGFTLKSVAERLKDYSAGTTALDAGVQYRLDPNLVLGASLLNLGGAVKFVNEETKLPTAYRVGAAAATKLFGEDINLAADLVSYGDSTGLNLGLEYLVRELLALRLGSEAGVLRAGVGITANLLALDYAYRAHEDLGAAHQLSFTILFGAPERAKKITLEQMALGQAYAKEGRFAEAIIAFRKVLEVAPGNQEAAVQLKRAQAELETAAFRRVFAEKEEEAQRTVEEIIVSGRKFLDNGKYLEALAEFSKVLKIDPSNTEALKLQSEAQFKMESQLIEKSRADARQYLGEAMKLVVTGQYPAALEQVNLALQKDPKNKEALALKRKLELILNLENK